MAGPFSAKTVETIDSLSEEKGKTEIMDSKEEFV